MISILNIVDIQSAADVVRALKALAEIDNDFNGTNGEEYLWNPAKRAGYKDNASFLADTVIEVIGKGVNKDSFEEYVTAYVNVWIGEDPYYKDYEVIVKRVDDGTSLAGKYVISLAIVD